MKHRQRFPSLAVGMCSCGKVRYATRDDAETIMQNRHWTNLHPYECCGYWHLGGPSSKLGTRRGRVGSGR